MIVSRETPIRQVIQWLNGHEVMFYDRARHAMPRITSHLQTPCVPANSEAWEGDLAKLAGYVPAGETTP